MIRPGFVALGQVAGVASSPLLGYLSDKFGRRMTLGPALVALGVGVIGIGVAPQGPLLFLAVAWVGAFMFPLMALYLAAAMDRVGTSVQATTVSLVYGAGTLFGSLSPSIAGSLADTYGRNAAFFWGGSIAIVAAAILAASGLWDRMRVAR